MSSLHERLIADTPRTACTLCAYLEEIGWSRRSAWQEELRQPVSEIGNTAIVRELWDQGVYLTEASVRRHRKNHG